MLIGSYNIDMVKLVLLGDAKILNTVYALLTLVIGGCLAVITLG